MTDSKLDRVRDELAGWPIGIGSGYYSTSVSVDEARDMADAVLAVLTELPESVIERVRELHKGQVDDFGDRFCVTCWTTDWPCPTLQAIGESDD